MLLSVPCLSHAEEPDKFDKDFNDSESEEEDDGDQVETALRKNERAVKVRWEISCETSWAIMTYRYDSVKEGAFTVMLYLVAW